MKQDRLKNDKRGWNNDTMKIVRYSWYDKNGDVCRADGTIVGNYLTGNFLLHVPESKEKPR